MRLNQVTLPCTDYAASVAWWQRFGLKLISIASLIEYRLAREQLVESVCRRPFPSEYGDFELHVFRSKVDNRHHLALTMGPLGPAPP
jgi:3,4-dihydroxy 2-butanone 4-phosphate synthase/GTP cyclohydrolase II